MTKESISFPPPLSSSSQPHYDESPKPYAYQYGVKDDYSGANFNAQEQADGKVVTGQYQGSRRSKALPLCHSSVKCLRIECERGRCSHVDANALCTCRKRNLVVDDNFEQNQGASDSFKKPRRKRFPGARGRPRSPYSNRNLTGKSKSIPCARGRPKSPYSNRNLTDKSKSIPCAWGRPSSPY